MTGYFLGKYKKNILKKCHLLKFFFSMLCFNVTSTKRKCAFGLCLDSEDPDQTARMRSLIWVFAVCWQIHWTLQNVEVESKGTDICAGTKWSESAYCEHILMHFFPCYGPMWQWMLRLTNKVHVSKCNNNTGHFFILKKKINKKNNKKKKINKIKNIKKQNYILNMSFSIHIHVCTCSSRTW